MSQPQPGWYDDPQTPGTLRYWDGGRWTEHREAKPAAAQQPALPQGSPHQGGQPQYQGSPYVGASQYQGAPYQPPRKKGGGGTAIAIVLVVGLVIVSGLIWQVVRSVGELTGGADPGGGSTPSTSATSEVPIYYMHERPGFDDMRYYVEGMHEKYSTAISDGTIYKYVPETDEGDNYAQAFVYILTDYKAAITWMTTPSTDADELDALIRAHRDQVAHFEELFLAGEDLGVTVSITSADGTVFESEGVAPEVVYDDPEEFAQNFEPQPDADGRYVGAVAELAAAFGMQVTYNYTPGGADGCTPSEHALEELGAVFCPVTPDLIWVNPANSNYPGNLSTLEFVHMIRHEIGHRRIFDICGTLAPPIALDVWEGVTNAYAVLYLGADQASLGSLDDSYAMTDQTFEMAEAIHNGQCT